MSPERRQKMAEFTTFRARAFDDLNITLKEMSGAAVTPQEAERQLKVLGDPSSDSPTQFKAKIENTQKFITLARARLIHARRNGLDPERVKTSTSLEAMPRIINQRAAEIERSLTGQGMDQEAARHRAAGQVAEEFGLR